MRKLNFTKAQGGCISTSLEKNIFLKGCFGCGKTTTALARIKYLIEQGLPGNQILVITPQRSLAAPYHQYLYHPDFPNGFLPDVTSLGGLARKLITLFWPSIIKNSSFEQSDLSPTFLNIETAQYYFAQVAEPYLTKGYLINAAIQPNRIYSQILDTMNKAAIMTFPLSEISERLKTAWIGDATQIRMYDQAQEMANAFRDFCLINNLLDYSLQIELLTGLLLKDHIVWNYLSNSYTYLFADNIEEDTPAAHDFFLSALENGLYGFFILNSGGGYRSFLGASPASALNLEKQCDSIIEMDEVSDHTPSLISVATILKDCIYRQTNTIKSDTVYQYISHKSCRFYPQMVSEAIDEINSLIKNDTKPEKIAILSPYLSDSLRYSIFQQFEELNIAYQSNRPSRPLSNEPAVKAILVLAKMAHPDWNLFIHKDTIRLMLLVTIPNLDLVRADLIVKTLFQNPYKPGSFDDLIADMQSRITFAFGEKCQTLLNWVRKYQESELLPLDIFISKLFGELLSQPGFGMHENLDMAGQISQLVISIKTFRELHKQQKYQFTHSETAKTYIKSFENGLISAHYISLADKSEDAVLVAPAMTFLTQDKTVDYQFWLDIGNLGWWERLNQPLTHPYVLSRNWNKGEKWTDAHEYSQNQENLARLVKGLAERCRKHIYLYSVEINESGTDQRGPLLQALQVLNKHIFKIREKSIV